MLYGHDCGVVDESINHVVFLLANCVAVTNRYRQFKQHTTEFSLTKSFYCNYSTYISEISI